MEEVILLKDVQIVPDILTVGELYTRAVNKEIAVMPQWLQRLQQKKKWQKNKGEKSRSFLRSFFNGNSLITPYYIVKIEILLDFIQNEFENEKDKTVSLIYKEMLEDLTDMKSQGVRFILLDGQNRLFEAIKQFFEGTLASNEYSKPFVFIVDGKEVLLNNFKYTDIDLDQRIRDIFFNTQILVAEGTDGDIESYVNSIVDMNNGESWSKFEASIIRATPLNYLINKDIFQDPLIQSLFGNHAMSGNVSGMTGASYEIEKKGDARVIAELVYLIGNECNSGTGSEADVSNMLIASDQKYVNAYHRVKKYLNFIADDKVLNCLQNTNLKETEKPISKESLRGLILFLDMMLNKNNYYSSHCVLKLRSLEDIEAPRTIVEEFVRWHDNKVDKKVTPQDFKNGEPIPGTYVFNTRGTSKENMIERMKFINEFIVENAQSWTSKSYISTKSVDYKSLENFLKKESNYIDAYSKANPIINLRSKVHVDHVKPRKKGGTNDIENLLVTNPKSNLIKASR
jgi:hypothetical protein